MNDELDASESDEMDQIRLAKKPWLEQNRFKASGHSWA